MPGDEERVEKKLGIYHDDDGGGGWRNGWWVGGWWALVVEGCTAMAAVVVHLSRYPCRGENAVIGRHRHGGGAPEEGQPWTLHR
jgi:hypothetical protein